MNTHIPMTFEARTALAVLREIFRPRRAGGTTRDVARELPGFPAEHRAGFTVSLLADNPRHIA